MNNVDFLHDGKVAKLAAGQVQSKTFAGKRKATGSITFADNPTANDTITINGVEFTFKAEPATAYEIEIGEDLTTTISNIVTALSGFESDDEDEDQAAADNAAVAAADYVKTSGTVLGVTAADFGTDGNAFTLDASSDTPSGETLEDGADGDDLDLAAQTMALETLEGAAMDFDLPLGSEGQEVCVYLKTKGTGANAVVNGAFVGGTKITFDTAAKYACLKFMGGSWVPLHNTGALA